MSKKDNRKIAEKLVEKATITKYDSGFDIDLITIVGYRREVLVKKEADAKKEVVDYLTEELESGNLVLSDSLIGSL